jgi:AcrR family transcriptional regulator
LRKSLSKSCVIAPRPATFYSHFGDKYDFFAFMVREMRRGFAKDAERAFDSNNPTDYYTDLFRSGLDFLGKNEKLALSIKNDQMLVSLMQNVSSEMTKELEKHLKQAGAKKGETPTGQQLQAQFLIGAMNQVASTWFFNQDHLDKETVIMETSKLIGKVLS